MGEAMADDTTAGIRANSAPRSVAVRRIFSDGPGNRVFRHFAALRRISLSPTGCLSRTRGTDDLRASISLICKYLITFLHGLSRRPRIFVKRPQKTRRDPLLSRQIAHRQKMCPEALLPDTSVLYLRRAPSPVRGRSGVVFPPQPQPSPPPHSTVSSSTGKKALTGNCILAKASHGSSGQPQSPDRQAFSGMQ